jgi:phage terminase small subunit/uncharacterized ParB-like nuclease family protein
MATPAKRSAQASSPAPVALAVADLQVDAAIQPRASLTPNVITEYATLYAEADDHEPLPPLDVFELDGGYYVSDGFHRVAAAQRVHRPAVLCRVYQGTKQDAIRHAALANLKRGLPYNATDRTQVLERLLHDPVVRQRSDRQLAAEMGLSHMTVYRARQRLVHIATLTQELTAQPTTATTPAARRHEQLATFLDLPVEQVALLAKHRAVESPDVIRDIARDMADRGRNVQQAKADTAKFLTYRAECVAQADAGQPPRRRETADERERRRAETERETRYFTLRGLLESLTDLMPDPATPEEVAEAGGRDPFLPDESPGDLIAAAESYIVAKHNEWEREALVEQLQKAYQVLDAFKAACVAQGWAVTF